MKIHPSIDIDKVISAAENQMFGLDNPGFCINCGAEHDDCEPDARKYHCEECGENQVYGAAELAMMMF
jgi:predicted amidophosphoribosyltransferase